jgi:hypothetical protein
MASRNMRPCGTHDPAPARLLLQLFRQDRTIEADLFAGFEDFWRDNLPARSLQFATKQASWTQPSADGGPAQAGDPVRGETAARRPTKPAALHATSTLTPVPSRIILAMPPSAARGKTAK